MTTRFGRWLAKRGTLPWVFAQENHVSRQLVYLLAGTRRRRKTGLGVSALPTQRLEVATLKFISHESGIPVGVLVEEAMRVLDEEVGNGSGAQKDGSGSGDGRGDLVADGRGDLAADG